MTLLEAGQWVIIEQPNGATCLCLLKPNNPIDLGRYGKLNSNQLIGCQAGLYYEVLPGNKLGPLLPADVHPELSGNSEEVDMATNESINDDNLAQKLTTEEIEKLKALHASGEASASIVVDSVIAGNENFARKNAYSKEKYVRRKQQKFMKWFCPRLPTTRLLAEHFNRKERDPGRMLDLRLDSLSQVLGHANLFSGARVMIWDDSQGFVTGAALSRMDSLAEAPSMLVSVHATETLQIPFTSYFNLSEQQKSQLYAFHLKEIGPEPLEPPPNVYNPSSVDNPEHHAKHQARWEERKARKERTRALFDTSAFSSLLLICNSSDPAALLDRFAKYLAPSGRLIIFSKYKEPVLPAFIQARFASVGFVDVTLTESFLRPYQTAAGRLHPEMGMPGSSVSGYILTATRVVDDLP